MNLNLARTIPRSAANGPGERFVVWTQGCDLACPGCWNPDTWAFSKRLLVNTADLTATILSTPDIEGVTLTGGEPFAQAKALAEVAQAVQQAGLTVFIFSGHELKDLTAPAHQALLQSTDVLVGGRYKEDRRNLTLPWRGSENQQVHYLTNRYSFADCRESVAEFHLGLDGRLIVTGFPPAGLLE